jgi:hypothetical protein
MLKVIAITGNLQTNLRNPTSSHEIGGSIGLNP